MQPIRRTNLIKLRVEHGLTRKQLAEILDISEVFVAKIEYGLENPSRNTALKFEAFYQISERVLFADLFIDRNTIKNEQRRQ